MEITLSLGNCRDTPIATDLAEVIGAAIAINLLFGIPLIYGAIITGFDTLLILALERKGFRKLEAAIIGMVAIIGFAYVFEILLAQPDWNKIAYHAVIPEFSSLGGDGLLIAVGILGATVIPNAIYLHYINHKIEAQDDALHKIQEAIGEVLNDRYHCCTEPCWPGQWSNTGSVGRRHSILTML